MRFFPGQTDYISLKQPVSKLASILLGEQVAILSSLTLGLEVKTYKQTVKEIQDLMKTFQEKGVTIKSELTPGHADFLGNEITDRLAKEVAQEAEQMKEEESVTAMTDIRKGAKESCFIKWQRKWELTEAEKHLFNFRPTVKSKRQILQP